MNDNQGRNHNNPQGHGQTSQAPALKTPPKTVQPALACNKNTPSALAGDMLYSIKEMAEAFDITARTLRHYEEQGLITPKRTGNNRSYSAADRVRLAWILRGKRVGFSLHEIGEMLDLYNLGDGRETQRRVTLKRCLNRIEDLKAQRADIDATIAELSDFCSLLDHITTSEATPTTHHPDGRLRPFSPKLAPKPT